MIKTIIFDLGNVIIRFNHAKIIKRIQSRCEFSAGEINAKIFATSLIHDYDTGKISSKEFFESVKSIFDLKMNFEEFAAAWNSTFDLETIFSEKFIERLSQKYRLLILSDTNDLHFEFIKRNFPIMRFFDDYVLSYKLGLVKPDAGIFKAAIEKADCKSHECLFTDDREINVKGAEKAGINSILFTTVQKFENDLPQIEKRII